MKALKKARTVNKADEDPNIITPAQYAVANRLIEAQLAISMRKGIKELKKPTRTIYQDSIVWYGERAGTILSMNSPDIAVLKYYQNLYFPPTFKNTLIGTTPYSYKNIIKQVLDVAIREHWNWPKVVRQMESIVNVDGKNFPRWMYRRIVVTETRRFVSEGHIRAHIKMGFKTFRRLETIDNVTNDECIFFNNYLYPAKQASGIIPWHPSCRGDMVPEGI